MARKFSMWKKLALLIASTYLALLVGEFVLERVYVLPNLLANYYPVSAAKTGSTIHVDQYEFDIDLKYNSSGFRDEEIAFDKKPGEKRILFLGDSATEGFGVPVTERYSNLLLDKLGGKYSGVNIAQLATNPDTYFDNLITFGLALKPDVVVMGVFLGNDFMGGNVYKIPNTYTVKSEIESSKFKSSPVKDFLTLRYVRELINQTKNKKAVLVKRSIKGNFWDIYFNKKMTKDFYVTATEIEEQRFDGIVADFNQEILPHYYDGRIIPTLLLEGVKDKLPEQKGKGYLYGEEDYINTLAFIKETDDLLKEEDIPFIVVLIPDVNQVHPTEFQEMLKRDFKFSEIPSRLKQLEEFRARINSDLTKEGVNYIDTTEALKQAGGLTYYLYDQHTNSLGHKVLSEEILKVMPVALP